MATEWKCWKAVADVDGAEAVLRIESDIYALREATADEVCVGRRCLENWYLLRKYKTQVCSPDHPRPYYDFKDEVCEIGFGELIVREGCCIGVYHEGLVFLFEQPSTHYRQKYLGEMPTGPDQAIEFYDYYYLRVK